MAQGRRRRLLTPAGRMLLVVIMVAIVVAAWWTQRRVVKGGDISDVAKMLPESTQSLTAVRGFVELGQWIRGQAARQTPESRKALENLKSWSTRALGIDLSDPQAIARSGFDFTTPWAVAQQGTSDVAQADVVVLIPVLNQDAALSTVQTALEKQRRATQLRPVGDRSFYVIDQTAAFTVQDGWLTAIGSARAGFDPVAGLTAFLDRDRSRPLSGSAEFQRIMKAMGDDWQVMTWGREEALVKSLAAWSDQVEGTLSGQAQVAFSAHATDRRIRTRFGTLEPGGEATRIFVPGAEDPLASRVDVDPFAAVRGRIDLPRLWDEMHRKPEVARKIEEGRAELQEKLGIDVKADVIDMLDGRFTVLGVRGVAGGDPAGVVAWAGLKDPGKARALLERLAGHAAAQGLSIRPEGGGEERWNVADEGGVGVSRDHLVMVGGEGLLAPVRASLQNGGQGYLKAFDEPVRTQLARGGALYGYLDARRTLNVAAVVAQQGPLQAMLINRWMQPAREAVDALLSGVSIGLDHRDGVALFDLELHAPLGGFTSAQAWIEQKLLSEQSAASFPSLPGFPALPALPSTPAFPSTPASPITP